MRKFLPVIFAVLAVFAWQRLHRPEVAAVADIPEAEVKAATFKCDGRQYCSQMTSCEEATYYLRNCPDVKMDGNHDGVPCERQWCNGR